MRKLVIALVSLLLVGCDIGSSDDIMDYVPVQLSIVVRDQQGNDLLDPSNKNNVLDEIAMEYDGKTYRVGEETGKKALPAKWFGLRLLNNAEEDTTIVAPWGPKERDIDGYYLIFGQWDGGYNYNMSMKLKWADGHDDIISYKRKIKKGIAVSDQWKLNGQNTWHTITITK